MRPRVLLFGSSGMLGTQILSQLRLEKQIDVIPIARNESTPWNAETDSLKDIFRSLNTTSRDFIINASGWIPQRSAGHEATDHRNAWLMNVVVPKQLDSLAAQFEIPMLQIGTDCVFSGSNAPYFESSKHDAKDLYGASKLEGEKNLSAATIVRTSIIGGDGKSGLFNWFQNLPLGARIVGYTNQVWNGVSTLAFARLSRAWLTNYGAFPRVQHWLPSNRLSKFDLLKTFAKELGRSDLEIERGYLAARRDLTLATRDEDKNSEFWHMAGYEGIPSIEELCVEFIGRTSSK